MKLRPIQYLGFGAGDAANNLTFSLVSSFLLIYYTDVAGIAAAAAGTLFLVVRVWGGIADLIAGRAVDATNTRWGKFRPYLLFASVPLLLLNIAVFSIPGGLSVTFLSPGTVRNYLAAVTQKLEAGSRADAYRIARENGWI
jgi:glucuronide carrier protein